MNVKANIAAKSVRSILIHARDAITRTINGIYSRRVARDDLSKQLVMAYNSLRLLACFQRVNEL